MGLAQCDFVGQAGCISMLSGPAFLFEDILNIDQFARILDDVKANRIGRGIRRELFASMASEPQVAHFAQARLIGLQSVSRSTAGTRKRVAQGHSRRYAPGTGFKSRHRKKIRARHCPV